MLMLFFAGCAVQPMHHCPGKTTADEAIAVLKSRREKAAPVRATGQCLLQYHAEGKVRKENFPVNLWVNPPDEIYLRGDVAFDATGLVFGSNADEFWFWLKPKEISSYWSGAWSQAGIWNGLAASPMIALEAFGAVDIRNGDWTLSRNGNLDLLTLRNDRGVIIQKIYIEPCDYVVIKMERFDESGDIYLRADFSGYEKTAEGFLTPSRIKIVAVSKKGEEDSADISLVSVKTTELNAQQRQRLFVRPLPRGFDHIYRVIDGKTIEQKQQ
ncbi:MAG: hypothetical protein ABSB25_10610 [Sedimentisphaerales bacterium]|jgi:hypothetical protein